MRKTLITSTILFSSFAFTQNTTDLKNEIDKIRAEIVDLNIDIQSVKSQNLYLKKVVRINSPILEQKNNDSEYKITKVTGNRKDKIISINFLIETKDENKTALLQDLSIVDLLGNQYEVDFNKSSAVYPKLTVDVPLNIRITFKEIIDEPKVIKLFKFSARNEPEKNSAHFNKSIQEFRDLNVNWE